MCLRECGDRARGSRRKWVKWRDGLGIVERLVRSGMFFLVK
jgi:hypothetical protein